MALLAGCATTPTPKSTRLYPQKSILVIAHRGASGFRPEHTLAAYELALRQGADFIEPDLVSTRDGILIARHENEIGETTDVAKKFPKRKTRKIIDGQSVTGWFTEDFTLAEIKTLRARERVPTRSKQYDGQYSIPTFAEIVDLVQRHNLVSAKTVGVYPEMKHPTYFRSQNLPLEPALAQVLKDKNWFEIDAPVYIQSFELSALRRIRQLVGNKLVFLYGNPRERPYDHVIAKDPRTYGDLTKKEELVALSSLLAGIGPWKGLILEDDLSTPGPRAQLIVDAHTAGLEVHPYTFRSDAAFLPKASQGKPEEEYRRFYELGVDGVFSDFPEDAAKARADFETAESR